LFSVIFFTATPVHLLAQDDPVEELNSHHEIPVHWSVVHHETVVVEVIMVSQAESILEAGPARDNEEIVETVDEENLEDTDSLEEELADPFGDDPFEEDPFAEEEVVIPPMSDPFLGFNRTLYGFNDNVYEYLMRPVAETYRGVVNGDTRTAIRNFFDNALIPAKLVSSLIQGKWKQAGRVISRTLINTIFWMGRRS